MEQPQYWRFKKTFDNEIVLEDWKIRFPIEEVIQENENIFTNFPKVHATISDLALNEKSVYKK